MHYQVDVYMYQVKFQITSWAIILSWGFLVHPHHCTSTTCSVYLPSLSVSSFPLSVLFPPKEEQHSKINVCYTRYACRMVHQVVGPVPYQPVKATNGFVTIYQKNTIFFPPYTTEAYVSKRWVKRFIHCEIFHIWLNFTIVFLLHKVLFHNCRNPDISRSLPYSTLVLCSRCSAVRYTFDRDECVICNFLAREICSRDRQGLERTLPSQNLVQFMFNLLRLISTLCNCLLVLLKLVCSCWCLCH